VAMLMRKYLLPAGLVLITTLCILFGQYIPIGLKAVFYALSLSIKDLLVSVLPLIIFSFLFYAMISLGKSSAVFVILLLIMVATSNFVAITLGYTIGSVVLPHLPLMLNDAQNTNLLLPLWRLTIPKVISNEWAILAGIVFGLIFAFRPNRCVEAIAECLNRYANLFLKKLFLPILPIFLLGFIMKLEHEDVLKKLFDVYGAVLLSIVITQIFYTLLLYLIVANGNVFRALGYVRNMLPAALTGFATISSAATIPVTMLATERNIPSNPEFARVIIPITANIHTLGSAIGLTILTLATVLAFGQNLPTHTQFFTFAFYYTMAKFAVVGIPGGVVIVVAPLLERYLGFSSEMIGLITAIYLLFDPFGTAVNISCNGAFAIGFKKVYNKIGGRCDDGTTYQSHGAAC
jgi:Na+/H+-dicarboxylate symporter